MNHYTIFAGKCKYANDFAGKGGILFEKPCILTRSLHNVASFRQNIYKGGYAMNEKNQKRELTYNEAKALLEQMYAKGDVEFAKDMWGGQKQEKERQPQQQSQQNAQDNQPE